MQGSITFELKPLINLRSVCGYLLAPNLDLLVQDPFVAQKRRRKCWGMLLEGKLYLYKYYQVCSHADECIWMGLRINCIRWLNPRKPCPAVGRERFGVCEGLPSPLAAPDSSCPHLTACRIGSCDETCRTRSRSA